MFGNKKILPVQDVKRYLPELRAYVRERFKPKEQKPSVPSEKPTPIPSGGNIRFSIAQPRDDDYMRSMLRSANRDPSVLDSPMFRDYYRVWEKANSEKKSFSSEVVQMARARYRKASQFYLPVGIDKRTFHRMKTDYEYKPSKNTAFRCCIGLHLNGNQADRLLKLAGYAFSPSDPTDLIIRFCLDNEIWDLQSINYLMDSFDLTDLEGYTPGSGSRF